MRAAAIFALGTLLDVGFDSARDGVGGDEDCDDEEKVRTEVGIIKSLLSVASDGSPLVRAEVAVGMLLQNLLPGDCSFLIHLLFSHPQFAISGLYFLEKKNIFCCNII